MLLLGAHFYRAGHLLLAAGALLSLGLLCIRRPPAVWLIQALLGAGTAEWITTAVKLVISRQTQGFPWQRLAVILGLVAFFTLFSSQVFRREKLRTFYNLRKKKRWEEPAAPDSK